jgi:hypothetical protein
MSEVRLPHWEATVEGEVLVSSRGAGSLTEPQKVTYKFSASEPRARAKALEIAKAAYKLTAIKLVALKRL